MRIIILHMETNEQSPAIAHFNRDLIWNLVSTVVLAVGGLLFSVLIALFYEPTSLGVFNQAHAYYVLFSQFAVMGVHIATGKYTAEHHLDADLTQRYLWTGLLCALCTSIVCFLVLGGGIVAFGLLQKSDVWFATFLTILALPLFSVNKVALSYLNGLSRMRAYAVFQAMRPILIVLTILACSLLSIPGKYLSSAFFVAELILTITFFLYIAVCRIPIARPRLDLAKELLRFGVYIFPGNLILEFNTRIDIIVLGLFTGNDYLVGIYSFAALFAEGFYQLFVVVRRIINPKITQAYSNQDGLKERLEAIIAPPKKYLRVGAPAASVLLVAGYYAACYVLHREPYLAATIPLAILTLSIALNSRNICLGNLLSDIGKPKAESLVNLVAAAVNFGLNCALVPFFGIIGSAVATGISYFVFAFVQRKLFIRHLGYTL